MNGTAAEQSQDQTRPTLRETAFDWARTLAYAVALALFLRTFFIGVFWIPTGSMEPTLHGADQHKTGDRVLVIRCLYGLRLPILGRYVARWSSPERGDIIVFTSNGISELRQRRDLIKRVVGVPGDTVEIVSDGADDGWEGQDSGYLYINGERAKAPDLADRRYIRKGEYGDGPVTLGPGEYLVFGDNTRRSNDSRFWGPVPEDNILGEAVCIYWPPSRIRAM